MGHINSDLEEIISRRWAKVQLSQRTLTYSNLYNRITMEIFFPEDRQEIEALLVSARWTRDCKQAGSGGNRNRSGESCLTL
jgi:hypothetical protein